jgi:hypothetical protein
MKTKQSADEIEREKFLAIRKEAGRKIDPATAEIDRYYCCHGDPYGVYSESEIPEELYGASKEYFFRAPGSDIWVWECDLPQATHEALYKRLGHVPTPNSPDPFRHVRKRNSEAAKQVI